MMIPRKTLKPKLSAMSVEKAGMIFKSMSVLHAKRKFHCYKGGFRYLLALAYENASHISSLQMNNRALAKAIQREKENTAAQLNEKILTESRYFDLLKEYSILKTKISTFEKSLTHIDESVKTSMIPNLVRLSDDITTLKMNCDILRNAVSSDEPDTTTRIYPRTNAAVERNPRLICNTNIPSPVTEESADETFTLSARKCKGGLRNVFNISNRDRRLRGSLIFNTNIDSSFTELNSAAEENRSTQSSRVETRSDIPPGSESSLIYPDSPGISLVTSSPHVPKASPAVALRRVLTPINTADLNDSVHSTTEISFKEKSPSISIEEDISRILPRSEHKRSAHSSFFRQCDDSGVTERKRPKQSHLFKGNGENKPSKKSETFKTSSQHLNVSSRTENAADNCFIENVQPRRSKSRRQSSRDSFRENDISPQNYSLIGERKRYRTRSEVRKSVVNQTIDESSNQSELKTEEKQSIPNTNFGNETTLENSLNDSRRLRTRSRNVCYKERPLNVKLRKN